MSVITLRVDEATRDEVDRIARARGITISELLRRAIDEIVEHKETLREAVGEMFGEEIDIRRTDIPRSLGPVQRQTLALLHEILSNLDPDGEEAAGHRRRAEVLQEGFAGEYSDEFVAIQHEMSISECELLWDILDMFRILKVSIAKLSPEHVASLGEHAAHALTFRGLDLNDTREARLLAYARHLISTGRWEDLADHLGPDHDRGNSHRRMLPTYLRMLTAFQPIWKTKITGRGSGPDGLLLTSEELAEVLRAWPHPGAAASG